MQFAVYSLLKVRGNKEIGMRLVENSPEYKWPKKFREWNRETALINVVASGVAMVLLENRILSDSEQSVGSISTNCEDEQRNSKRNTSSSKWVRYVLFGEDKMWS